MNNPYLPSYNSQQIMSRRSISLPNRLGGDISPWSFYKENGDSRLALVIPPIMALPTIELTDNKPELKHVDPSHKRHSSQIIDSSIFVKQDKGKLRFIAKPKMFELVNESFGSKDKQNHYDGRLAFGDRLVLPDLNRKFASRLLPDSYQQTQLHIQSIFEKPDDKITRELIRKRVLKGRRKSNVKMMFERSNKEIKVEESQMSIEISGIQKQLQVKKPQ